MLWLQAVRDGVRCARGRGTCGEAGPLGRQLPGTCRLAQGAQDRAAAAVASKERLHGAALGPGESILLLGVALLLDEARVEIPRVYGMTFSGFALTAVWLRDGDLDSTIP